MWKPSRPRTGELWRTDGKSYGTSGSSPRLFSPFPTSAINPTRPERQHRRRKISIETRTKHFAMLYRTNQRRRRFQRGAKAVLCSPKHRQGGDSVGGSYVEGDSEKGTSGHGLFTTPFSIMGPASGARSPMATRSSDDPQGGRYLNKTNGWKSASDRLVVVDEGVRRTSLQAAERRRLCVHLRSGKADGRLALERPRRFSHIKRYKTT